MYPPAVPPVVRVALSVVVFSARDQHVAVMAVAHQIILFAAAVSVLLKGFLVVMICTIAALDSVVVRAAVVPQGPDLHVANLENVAPSICLFAVKIVAMLQGLLVATICMSVSLA